MARRLDLAQIEAEARKHGQIVLFLNKEGAEYYIELLASQSHDKGAFDDQNYLRQQAAKMWPDEEWL